MSQILRPRGYQEEALSAINESLKTNTRVATVLATGLGKGHPLDTDVPTPDGLRKWGDLRVGDYVFGSNGQPTRVTAIYDQGVLPTFEVTLKHGERVVVDGDHLWQVRRRGRLPKVLSTRELASTDLMDGNDGYRWAIPVTEPVQRPTADLPLHPYVIGALLANGGMTHVGTILTTPDAEVIARVQEHVEVVQRPAYESRTCPTYGLNGLTQVTKSLGLRVHSRNKRIPRTYLEASVDQRIDLLRGLMDGDGSSRDGGRRSAIYHTTSEGLAYDVAELVTSLGGTGSVRSTDREAVDKPIEYRCAILMPSGIHPFSTARRDRESQPRKVFEPRSAIVSIEPADDAEIRCIAVEAPDSLYLITRNHIVTHNTVIFSHLIERAHREGRKSLVLVHREELAEQAKTKIHSVAPHLSVGIIKAERNEVDADVLIGSVPTLARPERRAAVSHATDIGLVIADEAHHSSARTWMEVLEHFGCWDGIPAVGFTATLMRNDGKGLGDIWETVAFERDINYGIDHGYLTDVRGQAITVDGLDLATVARNRGDYQEGQLGEAMEASGAGEVIAQAYLEHAPGRQGVLFAPTVATAYSFAESMRATGIRAETIEGNLSRDERALIYKKYETGEIDVLANCMVLTEGWDAPWAEVCVVARPTQSAALYTQMVGRVLRPWPGKDDALVLDVVGIAGRHKLQSLVDLVKTEVQDGESYAEARERIEKEIRQRLDAPEKIRGAVAAQQVELFANSHSVWLQTKGGVWFIPVTFGNFFLWPAIQDDTPGTFRLGYKAAKRGGEREKGWIEKNLTLEYAMAWGETFAELDDPTVSQKDRQWRRRKPSEAQIDFAIKIKAAGPEEATSMRKGALSDAISVKLASRLLDI